MYFTLHSSLYDTYTYTQACLPIRVLMAVLGTMAWQGSIKWWVLRHRLHHRFTDTPLDPYDATRGLWFSHIGWMLEKPTYLRKRELINMSDVCADPVVVWQNKLYPALVILLGFVLPTLLGALLFDDALGGFLYMGCIARVISWNGIFLINSLGHYWGSQPYSVHLSATQSFFLAMLSNGEANHNSHHVRLFRGEKCVCMCLFLSLFTCYAMLCTCAGGRYLF
jgi:stearoyl-CoA desaturase (delta-9 desaturase)